jgi:hypothetical protein
MLHKRMKIVAWEGKKLSNRRIINGLLIVSCLSLSACQMFQTPDPAMQAFVHGDYLVAYTKLEHRARLGDTSAQYAVGYMNYYGLGVAEDRDLALNWFKLSARYGYQPSRQALRILTHDAYKAEVNVAEIRPQMPIMGKTAELKNVDWIRQQNPQDFTVEVKQPMAAEKLKQANYPLVEYRYKNQDKIQQSWIYGDFKTEEQARAISEALSHEQVASGAPQFFLHSGLIDSQPQALERVCMNTPEWSANLPFSVVVGPFVSMDEAQAFQRSTPTQTSLKSYPTSQPVKVALRSLKDIQLAMLPD